MIAIIDYDAGNIKSVQKAFAFLGEESIVTRDRKEILSADRVVLPGVGAFGVAMDQLKRFDLDRVIHEVCDRGTPFLGICLGLQLLFEGSEESRGVEGLGILPGAVVKIPDKGELKIPHIGWNSLHMKNEGRLFCGVPEQTFVYFVHSYYLKASDPQIVKAVTEYGVTIDASVERGCVFACQFHPEKSSEAGLRILRNFAGIMGGAD